MRGTRWVLAALGCLLFQAGEARGQAGWTTSLSLQPFPPAYPSAWEFDPNVALLTVTGVPGTDPRYRVVMTMLRDGARVVSGRSRDRAVSTATLSDVVYATDLIDWPSADYSASARDALGRTERLAEGAYTLRVRVEALVSGRVLAEAAADFTIVYPDPPMILFPACGDEVITGFPAFQWTPVQVPIRYPVHYVLRIVEVVDGQIAETALSNNAAWYEAPDVRETNHPYPMGAQALRAGRTYAWQVQALDDVGRPPSTNNGRSEVCTFTVPRTITTEPPLTTDAMISVVRTLPDAPFVGSSFAGLEDRPFVEVLRRLKSLVQGDPAGTILLPLPSPRDFEPIALPDAEVSVDSILGSFAIASRLDLLGHTVDVILAGLTPTAPAGGSGSGGAGGPAPSGSDGGAGHFVFGFRPARFDLGTVIPALDGSVLDDLDLDGHLLCAASSAFRLDPTRLPPLGAELFGSTALDFTPGINFHRRVAIPGRVERLKRPCEALGITGSEVDLAGTLEVSLDDLRGGTITRAIRLSLTAVMTGRDPTWFPEWLDAGPRSITFEMDSTLRVLATAQLSARLDGASRPLTATLDVASLDEPGPVVLRAAMDEPWRSPFGVEWLELAGVAVELVAAHDSTSVAITGSFGVGTKRCDARVDVRGTGDEQSARFTGTMDALSLADALDLAARIGLPAPDPPPGGTMELSDVTVSFESSDATSFALSAGTRVLNVDGRFLIALVKPEDADPQVVLGVRVPEFSLSRLHSALAGTQVGGLTVPEVAFTYVIPVSGGGSGSSGGGSGGNEPGQEETPSGGSAASFSIPWPSLSLPALSFFRPTFGSGGGTGGEAGQAEPGSDGGGGSTGGSFRLPRLPGLNLSGMLPLSRLDPALLNALGIPNPDIGVHLSGKLGTDFGALARGDLTDLVGWRLSAELPSRKLGGLPEWLSVAGGERTLNISMDPDLEVSVHDVLAARLDGKTRQFRFGADLATGDSAAVTLRGTLVEPWESPYGLAWLELRDVQIELSTDSEGSAAARILGAFDIGSKSFTATIEMLTDDSGEAARFTGAIDELGLSDVFEIARKMGLATPDLEGDPVSLRQVVVSFESSSARTFAVSATATVMGAEGDFLVSVAQRGDADPELLLGVRIPRFPLADLAPSLRGTPVGDLTMPQVAFTVVQSLGGSAGSPSSEEPGSRAPSTTGSLSFPRASLSPIAIEFFRPVFGMGGGGGNAGGGSGGNAGGGNAGAGGGGGTIGGDGQDFTLELSPGLNLGGKLPLSPLGPEILEVLGFSGGPPEVVLRGSLGLNVGLFSGNGFASVPSWSLHAELPPRDRRALPDWLELDPNTQRTLDITKSPSGVEVSITDIMHATLDGARRTFVFSRSLATKDSSAAMTLRGEMQGGWKEPYGIKWMNLDQVSIELSAGTDGAGAKLASKTTIAGKALDVGIELRGSKGEQTATFTGSVDALSASEFAELLQAQLELEGALFDWSPPADLLDLKKPTITIVVGTETAFSLSALTTLFGQSADLMFFARKQRGQEAQFMLAARPQELSLSALLPELKSPVLDSFRLPKGALVVSKSERTIESKDLTPDTRAFYGGIYGTEDFRLSIPSGLSIVAPLPLGDFDADHPLKKALALLSPDTPVDRLVLEGTLPGAILGLGGPSGLSGLSLRASLPAIDPKPEWLVEAQLAIAITGRPSVGFAGHLTVKVDEDLLTFLTEINIAVVPSGVELGLLGALEAEEPWVAPLGVKWLTLNEVRLKTAINPVAVKFGFLGRLKIGEKDIEVIAMLPINYYTGVPTGIGLQGASQEGVALADIADLQNSMAQAAGRSQPKLPIDELPNIAVKDLDFRFSTLDDPDLDLRLGMAFGGQLWVEMEPERMENFAGILFDVGLEGILGKAHLGNFTLGPLEWKDALLDIAVTVPARHMIIEGGLDLGFAAGKGKMNLAKRAMSLDADVEVLGGFRCALSGDGEMALGASNLTLHGQLQSDFNGTVAKAIGDALANVGNDGGGEVVAAAQSSIDAAQRLLADREVALQAARAVVAKGREKIAGEVEQTKNEMEAAKAKMRQAESRMNALRRAWDDTPRTQVAKRADRWKDYLAGKAAFGVSEAAFASKKASHRAKAAAYAALKPVDEYPGVQGLLQDLNAAKARAEKLREELRRLKEDVKAVAASILPNSIVIHSAEFTTRLARARQGGGADMKLVVSVDGKRIPVEVAWSFGQTKENATAILAQLLSKIGKG